MNTLPKNAKPHGLLRILAICLTFLLVLPLLAGCGGASAGKPAPVIVVVGDRTVLDVVTELSRAKLAVTEDKTQLASADLILIAQNTLDGVTPQHRELVAEIAATGNRNLLWVMTQAVNLDDPELIGFEDKDARDLLYKYNIAGNSIQFAIDSDSVPVNAKFPYIKGWSSIVSYIKEVNR